ncbi:hypothetical protein ACFFJX_30455 [Pseudarcicella hirudinis]|uniref:hypothetical protein n=1 Tax=Pseudarcicella hirudinis TaxID=1079859 RepID=UPI0035E6E5E6
MMIHQGQSKESQSLFIADSNQILCETLRESLQHRKFIVSGFAIDGREAINQIRRLSPTASIISSDLAFSMVLKLPVQQPEKN